VSDRLSRGWREMELTRLVPRPKNYFFILSVPLWPTLTRERNCAVHEHHSPYSCDNRGGLGAVSMTEGSVVTAARKVRTVAGKLANLVGGFLRVDLSAVRTRCGMKRRIPIRLYASFDTREQNIACARDLISRLRKQHDGMDCVPLQTVEQIKDG
jgi:hypothetical protein